MTLVEWSELNGILPTTETTEKKAVSVLIDYNHRGRNELFHLSDFVVSSVSGAVHWMVPRR